MKTQTITSLFLFLFSIASAQTDHELITATLNDFIEGTEYNYPKKIKSAFYPNSDMFLYNGSDTAWIVSSDRYAEAFGRKTPGTRNERFSSISNIEVIKDVAFAKLTVDIPYFGNRFYDLILLKKIKGKWKMISKCSTAEPIPKTPKENEPKPRKKIILEGLNRPWSMAFLDENNALIAEKDGTLLITDLTNKTTEPIFGLPKDVARAIKIDTTEVAKGVYPSQAHGQTRSFNAGWFQVLLDPDFATNQYVYISYATENQKRQSTTKVIRGKLVENELTEQEVLFVAEPHTYGLFHYGGGMIFGLDGKLYLTVGERNFFEYLNPELPLSQDLADTRGKIYRFNPDGSIPEDNPDFGPESVPGLFATGIRAAQGLAIQPQTGDIWFSEHGTIQGDELNILKAGANYGWPYETSGRYRAKDYSPKRPISIELEDPVYYWSHTVAPTGLTFYEGNDFPTWQGDLIVPGLSRGSLWRVSIDGQTVTGMEELFINDRVRLRKAVVSPRGKLYLLTDEENGKLIQVINDSK